MTEITSQSVSADETVVVSIDAMGGDRGPGVIIAGLLLSIKQHSNIRFLVHGPENQIKSLIINYNLQNFCTIVHAERTVSMDDKPSQVMRHGKDTSMWSAVTSVKQLEDTYCYN